MLQRANSRGAGSIFHASPPARPPPSTGTSVLVTAIPGRRAVRLDTARWSERHMFNRGKNDGTNGLGYPEITLDDGRELKGKFNVPQGRSLTDILNGTSSFIEFEPFGGDRLFI